MDERELHYLKKGTKLDKRYTIESVLGEGGFGITYYGTDELFGTPVAIKEFYPQGIATRNNERTNNVTASYSKQDEIFIRGKRKFIGEAGVIAKFNKNKGIVNVIDFFEENNTAYIVMEYLDGITLKEYLDGNTTIPAEELLELLSPLLESLDGVHREGMIHRDISPDNIMVLKNGDIKLMDFGAARDYTEFGEKSLSIILKPGYAPPEQYQSHGVQGPWTDIYALCATIYKCLTGETPEDSIERVMDDQLKSPSEMGAAVPKHMEKALMKGMNVAVKDRYQNLKDFCDEFYRDIDEGVFEEETTKKPRKKSRTRMIAAAIVFCILLSGGGGYCFYQKSLEREMPDVVNSSYEDAALQAAGDDNSILLVKAGEEYSDTVKKGEIISQKVEAGTILKKGDEVKVIVSKGALVTVPDLTGKKKAKAKKLLTDNKLQFSVKKKKWSDKVKKGCVISQSIKAGEKKEEGTTVSVVLSKGVEQVKVPDVTGRSRAKAEELLKKAKLKMTTDSDYSSSVSEGDIISQSLDAGKTVDKNTTVNVVISLGEEPAPEPTYTPSTSGNSGSSGGSSKKKSSGSSTKKKSSGKTDSLSDWDLVN